MPSQTIYIIGAGAIGKSLAVFLKRENKKVILIRGSVDNKSLTVETIRVLLNDGTTVDANIEVSTLSNFSTLDGIIVLANKSYGNKDLSVLMKRKTGNSPIVVLQNGLGVEQVFIDQDFPAIYRCVLFVTSQRGSESTARFKPVSSCPIGIIKGNRDELRQITTTLSTSHFQFSAEASIQEVIWRKAIINSAFNSICPLLETDNGIFQRDPSVLAIAQRIIQECVNVAAAKGVHLRTDDIVQNLLLISRSSDGQLISTLQDIRNHRQTEIETLNFEIARIADASGLADQVKETKLLGELTKLKSELSLSLSTQ